MAPPPDPVAVTVDLVKLESFTVVSFPLIYIAPPYELAEQSLKLESSITAFSPDT